MVFFHDDFGVLFVESDKLVGVLVWFWFSCDVVSLCWDALGSFEPEKFGVFSFFVGLFLIFVKPDSFGWECVQGLWCFGGEGCFLLFWEEF